LASRLSSFGFRWLEHEQFSEFDFGYLIPRAVLAEVPVFGVQVRLPRQRLADLPDLQNLTTVRQGALVGLVTPG